MKLTEKDFQHWLGLPFHPVNRNYKLHFQERAVKIPVSIVGDCPNRQGLKGMETCIFCDVWGSAAYEDSFQKSLSEQIEGYHKKISKRFNTNSWLVYFQAYTSSFTGVQYLKDCFDTALSYDFVKGIVIGTRPDCLSPALFKLWNEYAEKTYFSVELGAQTFDEEQIEFLKRGHSAQANISACYKIAKACPKVELGLHFIFGIPGESDEHLIESAKIASSLPIQNVKIHNLHVLKNTGLEELYHLGDFVPISLEDFSRRCRIFLEHLSPRIAVHRLGAFASRWDELVAPDWVRFKMQMRQQIIDEMWAQQSWQGKHYKYRANYALMRPLKQNGPIRKGQPVADLDNRSRP